MTRYDWKIGVMKQQQKHTQLLGISACAVGAVSMLLDSWEPKGTPKK